MSESLVVQGRVVDPPDLELLRQWLEQNPGWSRRRLSQALAAHWDWRNGAGQLKDMAARTLLLKLDQRGLIALPPRRQLPTNRMRCSRRWERPGLGPASHCWRFGSVGCADAPRGQCASRRTCLGPGRAGPVPLFGFWRRGGREPAIRGRGTAKDSRWPVWSLARPLGSVRTGTSLSAGRLGNGKKQPGGGWPTTPAF